MCFLGFETSSSYRWVADKRGMRGRSWAFAYRGLWVLVRRISWRVTIGREIAFLSINVQKVKVHSVASRTLAPCRVSSTCSRTRRRQKRADVQLHGPCIGWLATSIFVVFLVQSTLRIIMVMLTSWERGGREPRDSSSLCLGFHTCCRIVPLPHFVFEFSSKIMTIPLFF